MHLISVLVGPMLFELGFSIRHSIFQYNYIFYIQVLASCFMNSKEHEGSIATLSIGAIMERPKIQDNWIVSME